MSKRRFLACGLILLGSAVVPAKAVAADDAKDNAVLAKLEEPISLNFEMAPLEDVLKFIKSASQGPNDSGIPIFVDPKGLQAAKATMTTPVTIESKEGEALKSSLKRMLKTVRLTYQVKGGLLRITDVDSVKEPKAGGSRQADPKSPAGRPD